MRQAGLLEDVLAEDEAKVAAVLLSGLALGDKETLGHRLIPLMENTLAVYKFSSDLS